MMPYTFVLLNQQQQIKRKTERKTNKNSNQTWTSKTVPLLQLCIVSRVCHHVNQVNRILIRSNEIPLHQLIIYDIKVEEWTGMKNVGGKSHTIMTMRVISIPSHVTVTCAQAHKQWKVYDGMQKQTEMAKMSDAISASFFLVRPNPNFSRDRFRPFRKGGSRVQHVPV